MHGDAHVCDKPVSEQTHERGHEFEVRFERKRAACTMFEAEAVLERMPEGEVCSVEEN